MSDPEHDSGSSDAHRTEYATMQAALDVAPANVVYPAAHDDWQV